MVENRAQKQGLKIVDIIHVDAHVLLKDRVLALNKKGYSNYVVCNLGKQVEILRKYGVPVQVIHFPRGVQPIRLLLAFHRVFVYLREESFDIVHTHSTIPGLLGRTAARLARVPVVIHTVHGFPFYSQMHWLPYKFFLILEKVAARFCDILLFQNKSDLRAAQRHGFSKLTRLHYIGNGIDVERFSRVREPVERSDYHSRSKVVVVCIARFERIKNHMMLLKAVMALRKHGENFEVWLVGDGPLKAQYESFCQENALRAYVKFLGYRHDVPQILSRTDIAVLTSIKEGIPRGLLEPMAMGIPVIATDVEGNNEAVIDGETGYLIKVDDVEELSGKLEDLIGDPELRTVMGRRAAERVRQEFDEQKIIERLEKVYKELYQEKAVKGRG